MRELYKYLHTKDGLTVVIGGKPYAISAQNANFADALKAVLTGVDPITLLDVLERDARKVREAVQSQLTENLEYNEGVVLYKGQPLYNHAVRRMLQMIETGQNIQPLARFIDKQQLNPDPVVIQVLYEFLEFGKIPLTADGDFLVYKAVRADFKDIHSGTFMNSVGSICKMPRASVDPDRNQTCSNGLHVCSYAYLPNFSQANGHVMMCKVNPQDVVAIPADYNNTKMRVARYEVVGEVTTYYKEGKDELGEGALVRSEDFEVWYSTPELAAANIADIFDSFYTFEEAKAQANSLKAENPTNNVWVEKSDKDEVLYDAK